MTILLAVIYASFISLGLPDAITGAAWPQISPDLKVSASGAGLLSLIVSSGTIIASFASGYLLKRLSTISVSIISVLLTAITLFGFAFAPSFIWLCILSLPLGLGAGAIDAAINSFTSLHYSAKHTNWLHAFWGVGAAAGPLIVSFWLNWQNQWRPAYITIAILQFILLITLVSTRWTWNSAEEEAIDATSSIEHVTEQNLPWWKLPLIFPILTGFAAYCGFELTAGVWAATFLAEYHGLPVSLAAAGASAYYIGITVGRFISGFATARFSNPQLLRIGLALILAGSLIVTATPIASTAIAGFTLFGIGCAPIYPTIIKETTRRLGAENTPRAMGLQMGFAYVGSLTMPPITGLLMAYFSPLALSLAILSGIAIMAVCNEYVEYQISAREKAAANAPTAV
ncbi:MFS transporter [Arcanobacterium hippocoleae]